MQWLIDAKLPRIYGFARRILGDSGDAEDGVDKVHRRNLVPMTRAIIRIIESVRGQTKASLAAASDDIPKAGYDATDEAFKAGQNRSARSDAHVRFMLSFDKNGDREIAGDEEKALAAAVRAKLAARGEAPNPRTTAPRESVEVWRGDRNRVVAVGGDIRHTELVGHDQDDVRWSCYGGFTACIGGRNGGGRECREGEGAREDYPAYEATERVGGHRLNVATVVCCWQ